MTRSRILLLIWLVTSIGIFIAASQDWYASIKPVPGIQKVVSTGLESFPLLATLPWVSVLCLLLIWYFGSIGKVVVAAITAFLSMAGAAAILLDGINANVLVHKVEKLTGIEESTATLMAKVQEFWPKYLTIALLILLALTSIISLVYLRFLPKRRLSGTGQPTTSKKIAAETDDSRELWDDQSN